ncbi:MAG: ATP-dependent DNA helicase RecG, partial [Halioglobus sp.]|nr:ATP-dependent DNA helicase RecG [Halioglobus sp.]
MAEHALQAALTTLKGVGPALLEKLARLRVTNVEDLLFLLPLRYEDRTTVRRFGELQPGMRGMVCGEVLLAETVYRGRRSLLVRIADGSGQLTLRFFHFSSRQQAQFRPGAEVACFGEARHAGSYIEMVHPEYRIVQEGRNPLATSSLTPVYPMTEGVPQGRIRSLATQALAIMQASPPLELLPAEIRTDLGIPTLAEALGYLHQPPVDADIGLLGEGQHPCQQRLAFEKLLAHYLSLRNLRQLASREKAPALREDSGLRGRFLRSLPFKLTRAQARVSTEILDDLRQLHPMMRLIQGDVGSGKTVVAAIACLQAIGSGMQAAIMAPTELLAEQHLQSFRAWLQPLGISPCWLAGSQRAEARRESLAAIANGEAQLVIGTHALFQETVGFHSLGLIVIDEQHRFGVHQRMALRDKASTANGQPHQLVMTATPIPRTLAMAAYADLDTSIIDELPQGRRPVTTVALPETRRSEVIDRVRDACARGQQAYWVCPLIEESEQLDFQAAEMSYAQLGAALPLLRVGLVHGRMKGPVRDEIMSAFKAGDINLLVATTVVEVGVDVANASLMIIENAERMGLSQLHQLRGRV